MEAVFSNPQDLEKKKLKLREVNDLWPNITDVDLKEPAGVCCHGNDPVMLNHQLLSSPIFEYNTLESCRMDMIGKYFTPR